MHTSTDKALLEVYREAFQPARCYILLPEDNSDWWEGHIKDFEVIFDLEDLAVSLFNSLAMFGYQRLQNKEIRYEKKEDGRFILNIPFQTTLNPMEVGEVRFILHPLRRANDPIVE